MTYDNVHVPLDNLIGEEGKGLQRTLSTLDGGRIWAESKGDGQGSTFTFRLKVSK